MKNLIVVFALLFAGTSLSFAQDKPIQPQFGGTVGITSPGGYDPYNPPKMDAIGGGAAGFSSPGGYNPYSGNVTPSYLAKSPSGVVSLNIPSCFLKTKYAGDSILPNTSISVGSICLDLNANFQMVSGKLKDGSLKMKNASLKEVSSVMQDDQLQACEKKLSQNANQVSPASIATNPSNEQPTRQANEIVNTIQQKASDPAPKAQ